MPFRVRESPRREIAPRDARRGARRPSLVPADVLVSLAGGSLETANFMEQFALDLDALIRARLPEVRTTEPVGHLALKARLTTAARRLLDVHHPRDVASRVSAECDTVRAIGCLAVGHASILSTEQRLALLMPFADDPHFAVREWAWIGLRDSVDEGVLDVIPALSDWAVSSSERVRRFASEILRPRGVWCRHLRPLRDDPQRAMAVIERLRADPSRYVQASVGNWLNDASVSQAAWVEAVCAEWTRADASAATAAITKRGMRGIIRRRQASAPNVPSS